MKIQKTWHNKAHREISRLCYAEYLRVNTRKDGQRYKKHHPYSVPEIAERLVDALRTDNELEAKQIFLYEL